MLLAMLERLQTPNPPSQAITNLLSAVRMLAVFIALAFSTALLMRLENNRRDKKAMTNPEYTAGEKNFDEMSGLRYEIPSSHSGQ